MNASEKAAATRAARQPIPFPGTSDYTAYRGSFIAIQRREPPRRPIMIVPSLDLLPECPITGSRFATHRDWIEALWQVGVLDTVDIAEIIGGKTTEAYVCGILSKRREACR